MDKKKYYKKIFNYFKKEKKYIAIYLITSILIVVINTFSPAFSAKTLEAITNSDLRNMIYFSAIILIIHSISSIVSYINSKNARLVQSRVEIEIKKDVSKELFCLEMKNFDKEGTGFFANRIENEPNMLAGVFTNIRYLLTSFFTSLGVFIYVFIVSPIVGVFLLISSLLNFALQKSRMNRWEKENEESQKMYEKYSSNFGELIRGIKDIKVLNLKNVLIKKTVSEQKALIEYNDSMAKKDQRSFLVADFLSLVMDFLFIVIGVVLIKKELLSGATFLVLYMYKGRASGFIGGLGNVYRSFKSFNISLNRLYEVVDGVKYPKEKFGQVNLGKALGNIEFRGVTFGYDDNPVIKDVSFKISKGETIGIVGKSGAGKSTIFNLLNKLYLVQEGSISIDGIDLAQLDEESIRENITTITQNPYIFNMTIEENLKIVEPEATREDIEKVCKLCALSDYIDSLEEKMDTKLGENGVILSGGLKQRLAIARAILKKSRIILLDEATSSLDNETQDQIHQSIKRIRKDYTILIIAHRLSTVIDCDKILVVDKGKIVGFDTHENLMRNNNVYKKLYKKELLS